MVGATGNKEGEGEVERQLSGLAAGGEFKAHVRTENRGRPGWPDPVRG